MVHPVSLPLQPRTSSSPLYRPARITAFSRRPRCRRLTRILFRDVSNYANSYQAGGSIADPTSVSQAYTNDPESANFSSGGGAGSSTGGGYTNGGMGAMSGSGSTGGEQDRANAWESRFGWRVDLMAAAAYLGGPVTALLLLILETQNDYVRFHAYQSALLTTPLLGLLLISNLLIPLPTFIRVVLIVGSVGVTVYTSFRAWKDAQNGLGRYWLPFVGEIADRWVSEE